MSTSESSASSSIPAAAAAAVPAGLVGGRDGLSMTDTPTPADAAIREQVRDAWNAAVDAGYAADSRAILTYLESDSDAEEKAVLDALVAGLHERGLLVTPTPPSAPSTTPPPVSSSIPVSAADAHRLAKVLRRARGKTSSARTQQDLDAAVAALSSAVPAGPAGEGGELAARDSLAELVALKDGPRDAMYEVRKPHAWRRAREVLAVSPQQPAEAAGEGGRRDDPDDVLIATGEQRNRWANDLRGVGVATTSGAIRKRVDRIADEIDRLPLAAPPASLAGSTTPGAGDTAEGGDLRAGLRPDQVRYSIAVHGESMTILEDGVGSATQAVDNLRWATRFLDVASPRPVPADTEESRAALRLLADATRALCRSLIAVRSLLDEPYPDHPELTPWTFKVGHHARAAYDAAVAAHRLLATAPPAGSDTTTETED